MEHSRVAPKGRTVSASYPPPSSRGNPSRNCAAPHTSSSASSSGISASAASTSAASASSASASASASARPMLPWDDLRLRPLGGGSGISRPSSDRIWPRQWESSAARAATSSCNLTTSLAASVKSTAAPSATRLSSARSAAAGTPLAAVSSTR